MKDLAPSHHRVRGGKKRSQKTVGFFFCGGMLL